MKTAHLDPEEQEILASYERGEWKPVRNQPGEMRRLSLAARNTLRKDRRINIRMSTKDVDDVRLLAVREGIPYQTLIASIIHKYVSGALVENRPGLARR